MIDAAEMLGPGWRVSPAQGVCGRCGRVPAIAVEHPNIFPWVFGMIGDGVIELACTGSADLQGAQALLAKAGIMLGECVGEDEQGHTFWTWRRA